MSAEDNLNTLSAAINTMLSDPESRLTKLRAKGRRVPCLTPFLQDYFNNEPVDPQDQEGGQDEPSGIPENTVRTSTKLKGDNMTITLQNREDYKLHVSVTPCQRPAGFVNLRIESQWLGARDPAGLQTLLDLNLPREQAVQLGNSILAGVEQGLGG